MWQKSIDAQIDAFYFQEEIQISYLVEIHLQLVHITVSLGLGMLVLKWTVKTTAAELPNSGDLEHYVQVTGRCQQTALALEELMDNTALTFFNECI